MNEINKPEQQQTEKPSGGQTPEQLRSAEAQKVRQANGLDSCADFQNKSRPETKRKDTNANTEEQVTKELDNSTTKDFHKESTAHTQEPKDKTRVAGENTNGVSATRTQFLLDKARDVVFGKETAYDAERFEKAGIKGAFDELPRSRREAVYKSFENAPPEIKKIANDLSDKLSVEDVRGAHGSHYDLDAQKIRMNANMDNNEYAGVFSHEYGHFVDHQKGEVSDTYAFREAIAKDLDGYNKYSEEGRRNFDNMMDSLMNSDAAFDRAVSDNLSAYFKNDPDVVQRYSNEKIDYCHHDDSYWSCQGNRESEIYANSFSMAAQDNKASCEFMAQYFPHTWEAFKKTL